MKHCNLVVAVSALLLLSGSALASSLGDPGGIIRKGDNYATVAIIEPGPVITFNGEPLSFPFNPFDFTSNFCPEETVVIGEESFFGPDCQFVNESGQTINTLSQLFTASPEAFNEAGGLTCINLISEVCSTGAGNALIFTGLGIPSVAEYASELALLNTNTDPFFNILNFGFDNNQALAEIAGISVPEPASLSLVLAGLSGLGLVLKRKKRAKSK